MNNIYDTANQLEREFRQLPSYVSLKEALQAIMADEESSTVYNEFREKAQQYQTMMMSGEEVTTEQQADFEALSEKVRQNDHIQTLIQNEQQINQILMDINNIITKPLNDIYQPEASSQDETPQAE